MMLAERLVCPKHGITNKPMLHWQHGLVCGEMDFDMDDTGVEGRLKFQINSATLCQELLEVEMYPPEAEGEAL